MNEIGEDAVWTLSTAKAGNGVQQLRDNNMQTFWQSDGLQPHLITLEFNKQARIKTAASSPFLLHCLYASGLRELRGHQLQFSPSESRALICAVQFLTFVVLAQDESYTPSLISIRTGTHLNDLQEVLKVRAVVMLLCRS